MCKPIDKFSRKISLNKCKFNKLNQWTQWREKRKIRKHAYKNNKSFNFLLTQQSLYLDFCPNFQRFSRNKKKKLLFVLLKKKRNLAFDIK